MGQEEAKIEPPKRAVLKAGPFLSRSEGGTIKGNINLISFLKFSTFPVYCSFLCFILLIFIIYSMHIIYLIH